MLVLAKDVINDEEVHEQLRITTHNRFFCCSFLNLLLIFTNKGFIALGTEDAVARISKSIVSFRGFRFDEVTF